MKHAEYVHIQIALNRTTLEVRTMRLNDEPTQYTLCGIPKY